MRTKRLGDMLLELGLITQEQLKQALEFQSREKGRLGSILIEHNFITERQLIDALRMQLGIEYIDLTKVDIAPEMSRYVPKNLAKRMSIVPVRSSKEQLFLAMADPLNFMAVEEATCSMAMKAQHRLWRRSARRMQPLWRQRQRPGHPKVRKMQPRWYAWLIPSLSGPIRRMHPISISNRRRRS